MRRECLLGACALLIFLAAGCAPKRAPAPPSPPTPPPPKQNVVLLLPNLDGKPGSVVVTNAAGSQELSESYSAVQVERSDVSPSTPYTVDQATVKRLFGDALDALPAPEIRFVLYFEVGKDELTAESEARISAIFAAIRERRSTAISVTGHTDTTGDRQANYQLGLKRAERVAGILRAKGLDGSSLFVASHGEADLLVNTARGVAEPKNRRVEVIVR